MAKRSKRRIRSPHPGVVLIAPKGAYVSWRAKYLDPDTQREKRVSLPAEAGGSDESRRKWAIALSDTVRERKVAILRGAPVATGLTLKDLIKRYENEVKDEKSDRTLKLSRKATGHFLNWCARNGVELGDELTRERLRAFRASRASERKQERVKGGKPNEYTVTSKPRLKSTVNSELFKVQAALGYLCDSQLLPRITRADLKIGLEAYDMVREPKQPLTRDGIVELLDACREADQKRDAPPIMPWVIFTLLTGLRFGEVVNLDWSAVDLSARDDRGERCGELRTRLKTKIGRIVSFDVSPTVRAMLDVLAVSSGRTGLVWPRHTVDSVKASFRHLPANPQMLRVTCACYLTNAHGIYGSASAYHSARRMGHSVTIAEKHYLGLVRGIPTDARTLEAAMGIEEQAAEALRALGGTLQHSVKRDAANKGAAASFGDLQLAG